MPNFVKSQPSVTYISTCYNKRIPPRVCLGGGRDSYHYTFTFCNYLLIIATLAGLSAYHDFIGFAIRIDYIQSGDEIG